MSGGDDIGDCCVLEGFVFFLSHSIWGQQDGSAELVDELLIYLLKTVESYDCTSYSVHSTVVVVRTIVIVVIVAIVSVVYISSHYF